MNGGPAGQPPGALAHEDSGHGTPVVLLHGVGLDRRMWDRCRPALAARHRVRAVDLRGHGASPAAAPGLGLTELADDVLKVSERPAHLVGFSLGALVAAAVALREPSAVASLTLVSSVARRSARERESVLRRLHTAREDFTAAADAAVERWFAPRWRAEEPQLADSVRATLLGQDRASYLACYEVFARADAELWPRLGAVAAPTLAVTGSEDPGSTPLMTRRLADAVPGARYALIEGARHLLPLEAPEALTNEIIRHITEVERDGTAAAS
ncbi:alpha/beta fold hydrolase [Streptomyces cacaoi]|uniref:3-oxoadipate enol-lactonase n=1 Tax=Streptomyces cacaoi TaxID=1898 RepID=A0A4Y3R1Z2_STRCI|nr:alpha/beta fold hydrolase [Streptomyces cacaoi]GEB50050.1 3-oxoadipate enol-lactonase [Streptomyces cacaoi]